MKKAISKRLSVVIAITMLFVLLLNLFLQIDNAQNHVARNSQQMIQQMALRLEAVPKEDVQRVFSGFTAQEGRIALAVDADSKEILGATRADFVEKNAADINLVFPKYYDGEIFWIRIGRVTHGCLFSRHGDLLVGMIWENTVLFNGLPRSMFLVLLYLSVAAIMLISAIMRSLDRLVIDNINTVNKNLSEIVQGNLDQRVHVDALPEFVSLSSHVNQMADTLLNTTVKISRILDATDAQIGFFEYNTDKGGVLATRKVATILMIAPGEMSKLLEDKDLFEAKIAQICANPVERCKNVYSLQTETACYVKLETFCDKTSTFGIVMDVTEEIIEKARLRHERDYDLLTQLLGRRPFYRNLTELFATPERIGHAVMMMFDLDGLKTINDTCGHAGGDKAIRAAAALLEEIDTDDKLVSRLSGDEFAVFIYGAESCDELQKHIDDLFFRMQNTSVTVFDHTVSVRLSGGYVFCSAEDKEYHKLLRHADQALYHSKRTGKSKFSEYCEEFDNLGG